MKYNRKRSSMESCAKHKIDHDCHCTVYHCAEIALKLIYGVSEFYSLRPLQAVNNRIGNVVKYDSNTIRGSITNIPVTRKTCFDAFVRH